MEKECEIEEKKKLRLKGFVVNKRATGPSTPPPTWRLEFSPPSPSRIGGFSTKEFLGNSEVSVRKLCADLWETEQFRQRIELRRRDSDVESSSTGSFHDHKPPSRGSSRKQIAAKRESNDDHRPVHRNGERLQPISPSSRSNSSLKVGSSSMVKSASYGLTSSTKLLKVLNRIWSLEEQNAALKIELDECRSENKDKRVRKKTEEEVFRLLKKELDEERKVRKQSESLHRKLTRELCEAKHCLSKALKDLEIEKKERVFVENLFASRSSKGSDLRAKPDDLGYMDHQRVCLKELEEKLENGRTRRDNKLVLKKQSSNQVLDLSISSEGDKIHPEASPRNVDEGLEKSRTFLKNLPENRFTLKDKLMEARVESRRFRSSLKVESSPSLLV